VTSSYRSPTLGRSIALAMVAGGRQRIGDTVHVFFGGRTVPARVVPPRFIEPSSPGVEASAPTVSIERGPAPLPLVSLRGDPRRQAFLDAVRSAVGSEPPTAPNTVAENGGARILWLGPDEWLVAGDAEAEAALGRALAGTGSAVVDVACAYSILTLGGAWRDTLAAGCKLDLRPAAFGPGCCARTLLARASVILEPRSEAEALVYVRPSYESYLRRWLAL
jgi:sarcosine oxidase subunit gamma